MNVPYGTTAKIAEAVRIATGLPGAQADDPPAGYVVR
jgi:hypothetical protein